MASNCRSLDITYRLEVTPLVIFVDFCNEISCLLNVVFGRTYIPYFDSMESAFFSSSW